MFVENKYNNTFGLAPNSSGKFFGKKIYNAAVIGYSALNYFDLIDAFLRDHDDIEKVILFFCLNDVYGGLTSNNRI
jgi:hypothetical protein